MSRTPKDPSTVVPILGLIIASLNFIILLFNQDPAKYPAWAQPWLPSVVLSLTGLIMAALTVWILSLLRRRRIRPDMIPMNEAALYLTRCSTWIKEQDRGDEQSWYANLQRDLLDALVQGHLMGAARRILDLRGAKPGPTETIDADTWKLARLDLMDGLVGNRTANRATLKQTAGLLTDIRFDRSELKRLWPSLTPLGRLIHRPLKLKVAGVLRIPAKTPAVPTEPVPAVPDSRWTVIDPGKGPDAAKQTWTPLRPSQAGD